MKITVEYNHYLLRKITNIQKEIIEIGEGSCFEELLRLLQEKYGEKLKAMLIDKNGKIRLPILINGISLHTLEYRLEKGDRVNILALTAGG